MTAMSIHNLDYFIVADLDSGTFFGAKGAVILDTRWLSPEELEQLNEGSDSERFDVVDHYGTYLDVLLDPSTIESPGDQTDDGEGTYGPAGDFSSSWLGQ
jgi:hypothetical protein